MKHFKTVFLLWIIFISSGALAEDGKQDAGFLLDVGTELITRIDVVFFGRTSSVTYISGTFACKYNYDKKPKNRILKTGTRLKIVEFDYDPLDFGRPISFVAKTPGGLKIRMMLLGSVEKISGGYSYHSGKNVRPNVDELLNVFEVENSMEIIQ